MAYEQKNGEITIWKNDKYETGGNQPYARGTGKDLQGNDIDVALWIPKSDKVKGFNMTIKPAYKKEEKTQPQQSQPVSEGADLPF